MELFETNHPMRNSILGICLTAMLTAFNFRYWSIIQVMDEIIEPAGMIWPLCAGLVSLAILSIAFFGTMFTIGQLFEDLIFTDREKLKRAAHRR